MAYALVAALLWVMLRPLFTHAPRPKSEPLRVRVAQLAAGQSQGIEWQRRRILLVRPGEAPAYLAVLDYDPLYGCPLLWVAAGDNAPPIQPWPGGFRAICRDHWYNSDGKALSDGVGDLTQVPFSVESAETLLFTDTR